MCGCYSLDTLQTHVNPLTGPTPCAQCPRHLTCPLLDTAASFSHAAVFSISLPFLTFMPLLSDTEKYSQITQSNSSFISHKFPFTSGSVSLFCVLVAFSFPSLLGFGAFFMTDVPYFCSLSPLSSWLPLSVAGSADIMSHQRASHSLSPFIPVEVTGRFLCDSSVSHVAFLQPAPH